MTSRMWNRGLPSLGLVVVLALLPTLVLAADRPGKRLKFGQFNPEHTTVEMFQAIKKGQIDVKLIPKNSTQSQVLIENKTKQPLNVQLPDAFAGVPVLAQLGGLGVGGGLGAGGGLGGGGGGFGGGQAFGGGFGGGGLGGGLGGGGFGGGGLGGGAFNVPPEKVGKFKVATVCLEHGKREPRAAMKYQIKPIEEFTDKKEVHELCRMLGTGRINQRAAQVAAWHLNNDMSWAELAAKRIESLVGPDRPYFTPQELRAGVQLVTMAANLVKQREKSQKSQKSPGEEISLSTK